MKKLLGIVVLGLLLSTNVHSGSTTGSGDLKLSRGVLSGFIKYLDFNAIHNKTSGAHQRGTPGMFSVSQTGSVYGYSYCPIGEQCRPSPSVSLNSCRERTDENCYIFANNSEESNIN